MRIYKIYIILPKKIYNLEYPLCFPDLNEHQYIYSGLYAWTDSKKVVNEFFKMRKKKYFKVKREYVDDDVLDDKNSQDYEFFKKKKLLYLDYLIGKSDATTISILSTNEEYTLCEDFCENLHYNMQMCDYAIFKPKYIKALDFISYTTEYDLYELSDLDVSDSDAYDMRIDKANDMISYGMTSVYGFTPNISIGDSTFSAFLRVFNFILK